MTMERATREPLRGRGAVDNPTGRFEVEQILPFDDEWGTIDEPPPRLRTIVQAEVTRRLINTNRSPDIDFDLSINPYKGCEHGCVYCVARPTHAFLGLSPGLDFETRIFTKPDAPALLRSELARRTYEVEEIVIGANTDAYQPVEEDLQITRQLLEVMLEYRQPVRILTKSDRVLRDLDVLRKLARHRLVQVVVSVTTLDPALARKLEPRASSPARRLRALRRLAEAGVPTGVLVAPVIPALNDSELEAILRECAAAGVATAGYALLRLPLEVAELFEGWLQQHYPDRVDKVMDGVRECRGGALHQSDWGLRMRGSGPWSASLRRRYEMATRRLGLAGATVELDRTAFRVPRGDERQLSLFVRAS